MHLGDGEFKLTDPVDSTGITGVECKRTHDGDCGVMQFEQLQSQRNCEVIGNAWKDILSQLPHAAALSARDESTYRSFTCWLLAGSHGIERR